MKRTNESGRSMVEMLGVLAIIGVLSIGGIAGYVAAMNRYRANEVIDMATKYATVAYTSCQTQKTMSGGTSCTYPAFADTGLGDAPSGLASTTPYAIATGDNDYVSVTITFASADDDVCFAAASALGYSTKGDTDTNATGWENCESGSSINMKVKQS